ncbi:MAG: aromatic ring-hydroxylating dioxygenase subunit alpha [Solirubrobacteraceae bacterium]
MDSIAAPPTSAPSSAASAPAPSGIALEPPYYTDVSLQDAEQELIFERTWQLAGHVSQLPRPGSYITAAAGSQPVLVVRDDKGGLRAYLNVCRHRGSRLLSGSGQCKAAIRCRYHGWTYKLDGSLIGVPEGLAFGEKLDKPSLSLMPVRVEEMCGLVFVNLDEDAAPLAELVGDLPRRLAPYQIETLTPFAPAGGTQPANWKVVADNYIEGYHIPIAHPGLMRMLDYKRYDVEVNEHYLWFDAPMRDKPSRNRLERVYAQLVTPMPGLPPQDRTVWRYVYIYPNTTIDLYPDQVGTWQLLPDGVARTRDVSASYRPPGTSPRTRFVQWANQRLNTLVLDEDIDLVDNVQQGLMTRGYRCGPLSARERGVAWFADRIRADLAPAMGGAGG